MGGFSEITTVHLGLLERLLLPLHSTNSFLDEQTPLIELYHEPLVHCLVLYIQKLPSLLPEIVRALASEWPSGHFSNSPKVLRHRLPPPA